MSNEVPGQQISLEAGADLSAKQFFFVEVAADGQVDPAGAGADADGVLQGKPAAAGRAAAIMLNGVSKVSTGAAVARGALVMSDASGQAVTATGGSKVLGKALEASGGANQVIKVLLRNPGDLDTVVLISGADLSAKQNLFMAVASDGKIDPAGDGVVTCGVLQNAPAAVDLAAECKISGLSNVISGAAFTAGDAIGSDANGKAITAASGDRIQGVALATASGADETIAALIFPTGNLVA